VRLRNFYSRVYGTRRSRGTGGRWATIGFVGGVVAGLVLWSLQMKRSQRDLFSKSPIKRLAALGYLGGQSGIEAAHLLAEYCQWEKHPMLKKRANKLLSRMRARLV
jgi:hypothetical protein